MIDFYSTNTQNAEICLDPVYESKRTVINGFDGEPGVTTEADNDNISADYQYGTIDE